MWPQGESEHTEKRKLESQKIGAVLKRKEKKEKQHVPKMDSAAGFFAAAPQGGSGPDRWAGHAGESRASLRPGRGSAGPGHLSFCAKDLFLFCTNQRCRSVLERRRSRRKTKEKHSSTKENRRKKKQKEETALERKGKEGEVTW